MAEVINDWNCLKVGDAVATCQPTQIGWGSFRYPTYTKRVIARITPKRTKVTMQDGSEWKKPDRLYRITLEDEKQTAIAKAAQQLDYDLIELTSGDRWKDLDDDEIIKLHNAVHRANESLKGRENE